MRHALKFFPLLALLIVLIIHTQSQMTEAKRKELLDKFTKPINYRKEEKNVYSKLSIHYDEKIKYEPSKIKEVLDKYKFPQSYNFIDEEKPSVHIKDQEECGSCWAFSSTTALSYRYHKLGIDVNLSPQYLISCYIKDCNVGDQIIDTQLFLVRNGTVTEECMPYTSQYKKVEECPNQCKNGGELNKYYSKNSYTTGFDYYQESYYDIVAIIIDQLINYGPVVSGISIYNDFYQLRTIKNCFNKIYKYDQESKYYGGHAVVIVGYGYQDSKYYWIIQNSWGESFCGGGFAKIEFAEIGIEEVVFAEPYIYKNSTDREISVKLNLDEDCKMDYTCDSDDTDDSFEMNFENTENPDSTFYYQCGLVSINNKKKGICNYEIDSLFKDKGYYKFSNYQSLKKNNVLNLNFSSFSEKQFYFYGYEYIDGTYEGNLYISEEGRHLLLCFDSYSDEDSRLVSKLYSNINNPNPLNCEVIPTYKYLDFYFISCTLEQNHLDSLNDNNNLPLVYDFLCGGKEETGVILRKLDKTKHALFRVKTIIMNKNYIYQYDCYVVVNNEGSSNFNEGNGFGLAIFSNKQKDDLKSIIECTIPSNSEKKTSIKLHCYYTVYNKYINEKDNGNIKIYPYIYEMTTPFDVYVDNNVNIVEEEENVFIPIPNMDYYININLFLFAFIFALL